MATPNSRGLHLALTGGIGSGKSTVATMLQDMGATLFDADAISRELTAASGAAMPALKQAFGAEMVDEQGALRRDRMRELAFRDPEARARLEGILHPLIGQRREALVAQAGQGILVFDIPLLTEASAWRARVDRILVVDCLEATQIERVQARSGLTPDAIERVMHSQASRAQRRAIADAVIFNEGLTLQQLQQEVQAVLEHWGQQTPQSRKGS